MRLPNGLRKSHRNGGISSVPYFFVSLSRNSASCFSSRTMYLEHREELMLAEFEKCVAFALVEFFEIENILVKRDRFFDVVHLDRDVIAAVNLHAHWFGECLR